MSSGSCGRLLSLAVSSCLCRRWVIRVALFVGFYLVSSCLGCLSFVVASTLFVAAVGCLRGPPF